jgi:hypothetical protein
MGKDIIIIFDISCSCINDPSAPQFTLIGDGVIQGKFKSWVEFLFHFRTPGSI